jgi:hypothetical protein
MMVNSNIFSSFQIIFFVLVASFSQLAQAQNNKINFVNARQINVVEEIIHPAKVRDYSPKLVVGQLKIEATDSISSPESTVINWIGAMQNKSYPKAISFWDNESQQKIATQNAIDKKSNSDWELKWQTVYASNKVVSLVSRVDYGSFVLIEYVIFEGDRLDARETVALQSVDEKWLLTLALSDSAILQGWQTPDKRVRRLPKFAYKKLLLNN